MDQELIKAFAQTGGVGLLALGVWLEVRLMRKSFISFVTSMSRLEGRAAADSDRMARIENRLFRRRRRRAGVDEDTDESGEQWRGTP